MIRDAYSKSAQPRQCGRVVKLFGPTDSTEDAKCYIHESTVSVNDILLEMASTGVQVDDGPGGEDKNGDDAVGKSEGGVEAGGVNSGKTS